ncbi:P-loop containing nucleoside triphosphate hydrolase protein [Gymnopus androsaceus JB14]|uniref:ATP-dependent RNA helicase n=1 Tax=Gymnopus androsaceus JB14 TaxID=1447944 RepID=A0A6A4I4G9_9AGAR|nr:P-loop containing nucleoside triphosphate hydrolase protein [Gymnopus androsaceus JB14]
MEAVAAAAAKDKDKTKAKQRYLKRKKERRKVNKKSKPKPKLRLHRCLDSRMMQRGGGGEEEEPESGVEEEVEEEPPTKKRKISIEPATQDSTPAPAPTVSTPAVSAPLTLPTFPLPALPNPPSKSTLALQGLDRALVNAEIVPASRTVSIVDTDADRDQGTGGTHLGFSEKMRKRLVDLGITELFAVQTSLLPFLLPFSPLSKALYQPYNPPPDVCVSAPTGSGKTLAYAVPIVEILSSRIVTRLRALVVLPTRDLVLQVRETFEAISKGRGLKIGTATGQHSFSHEQAQLVGDHFTSLQGGSSKIDILICTPGRLMDHLKETRNFSLQHLRFLVIDEADRLLAQSFQDWLVQVLQATRPPKPELKYTLNYLARAAAAPSVPPVPDALSPSFLHLDTDIPSFITERKESSCQKLLFSATLTWDPSKIAALGLHDPKYFIVQGQQGEGRVMKGGRDEEESGALLDVVMEKFSMPATLKEHFLICTTYQKPLVFFHLVHSKHILNPNDAVLVFTKSAESTERLVRLFGFLREAIEEARARAQVLELDSSTNTNIVVQAYSSDLAAAERKSILEKFKAREIHILVCSDLISRGIDISHVSHVVSYDAPVDMRKYVHRVGRTARAGREGDAWTLVEEQEARHFKIMMKDAKHLSDVKRLRIGEQEFAPLVPHYETALSKLKAMYSRS